MGRRPPSRVLLLKLPEPRARLLSLLRLCELLLVVVIKHTAP